MSILSGKKILIFQQRGWGKGIGRPLAKRLYFQGCRLAALTFKKTTHELIVKQPDVHYDLIIDHDEILNNPRQFLGGDKFSLEEICDELSINSIWPLLWATRLYVYSYKEKYYYSFRQNVPDETMVDFIMAMYKCAKLFFDKFKPDIVVAPNFVATGHLIFNLFAEKHGIKMLSFIESKVQDRLVCIYNYEASKGPFFERLSLLDRGIEQSKNLKRARQYIREFKREFKKLTPLEHFSQKRQKRLWQKIKEELYPYKQILEWWLKTKSINHLENIGPTIDNRPPKLILRDHYCSKAYKGFMQKFPYHPFNELNKFVYFPLQQQPETLLEVISPYVVNQIETARQVAMSLPGDWTMVVKEHPTMVGLRPPSYIEKVSRTPNVKLIDYRLPNEIILKKAGLVISAGGTTVAEAAFLDNPKPVIQLGNMGITLKLPNVFKHSDLTTLSAKIKEVLAVELNTPEYQRKLENYVAAVYDTGHQLDFEKMWEPAMVNSFCNAYIAEIKRVIAETKYHDLRSSS